MAEDAGVVIGIETALSAKEEVTIVKRNQIHLLLRSISIFPIL